MIKSSDQKFFKSIFDELLQYISQDEIDYLLFTFIIHEARIQFLTQDEHLKFKRLFLMHQQIPKNYLKKMITYVGTKMQSNKPSYIIKMKESDYLLKHKPDKCFKWWRKYMTQKYGSYLRWFDQIGGKKDLFRIKSFQFKQNISNIIAETEHSNCTKNIMSYFPKNLKNQIQFSTFMNTLKNYQRKQKTQYRQKKQIRFQKKKHQDKANIIQPRNLSFVEKNSTKLRYFHQNKTIIMRYKNTNSQQKFITPIRNSLNYKIFSSNKNQRYKTQYKNNIGINSQLKMNNTFKKYSTNTLFPYKQEKPKICLFSAYSLEEQNKINFQKLQNYQSFNKCGCKKIQKNQQKINKSIKKLKQKQKIIQKQ